MITRLPFDPERLVTAMLYVAARVCDPTKFKIGKIIFLADFVHIAKYGRAIVGGRYCALPNGPVPSEVLDLLNGLITGDIAPEFWGTRIETKLQVSGDPYPTFLPKTKPDMSMLSESDVEILDKVIAEFGDWSFRRLVEFTHSLPAYMKAAEREPDSRNPAMDYEDFFEGNSYVVPGTKQELLENYALSRAFPEQMLPV
jgi:uncharacterized phage-associated protein